MNHQKTYQKLKAFKEAAGAEIKEFNSFAEKSVVSVQFQRRTLVRTTFSVIEAHISHLKQTALFLATDMPGLFSDVEILALKEEDFNISDNGKVKTSKAKIKFKSNMKFAFSSFARIFGKEYNMDLSGQGWEDFKNSILVRDRITHPKSSESWEISEEEEERVVRGWLWFKKNLADLAEICKNELDAGDKGDKASSSGL